MKLKNELMVICLILFILISVSAVSAANNNTDIISVNDNENNDIISINSSNEILTAANDGSFADLNNKINGGSANIVLDRDYTYSGRDTIKDGIVISKNNVVIDGNGHTIDAKGKSRIFNVTGTTVTLKNIIFTNGYHDKGGAVRGYGDNLRVYNCTFTSNTAKSYGGAIFSYPDSYTAVVNSTFTGNNAKYGGAVATYNYVGLSSQIDYTTYGARHDIVNCTFDSNTATVQGGALAIEGKLASIERPKDDTVNIRGCSFTKNKASEGDAISNMLSAYINMTDSVILGNQENVIYSWGAMFFADYNWWGSTVNDASLKPKISSHVRFTKWLYMDFVADLTTSSATVSINNLYDGTAAKTGTYSTTRLPCANVKFTAANATFDINNDKLDHAGKYETGFTLLGDSTLTANVEGISISQKLKIGGLAQLAALIKNTDDDKVIKLQKDYVYLPGIDNPNHHIQIQDRHNLVIDGNGHTVNGMGKTRLFALDKYSTDITFKNINIVNGYCDDDYDGSAGLIYASNTKFINCTFKDNVAAGIGAGGALHINAGNVNIADCRFINNTHKTSSAGAVYIRGENARIVNTLFENNSADAYHSRAGALLLYNGGDVERCTFIHNTADCAGAMFNYEATTIDDCTFMDNIALGDTIISDDGFVNGAGAVYAGEATITDSRFINNTAISGSAIIIASPSVSVDRCLFVNNTAKSSNGIILGVVAGGSVTDSIFLNNNVAYNSYLISTIYGKLKADYNWFGNIEKNYDTNWKVSNLAEMSKWLFVNATSPLYNENEKSVSVQFNFFAYDSKTKKIVRYDCDNLPEFKFTVSTQNLTINKNSYAPEEKIKGCFTYAISIGEEGIVYRYDYKGLVTAQYEDVKYVVPFSYQRESWFEADSKFELMKDEFKYLDFTLHPFEYDYIPFLFRSDSITYKINDTSVISFNKATCNVKGLKVGLATIIFKFNGKDVMGRDKYCPSNITILVNVTRAETHIENIFDLPDQVDVGVTDSIVFSLKDFKNKSVSAGNLEYVNNNPSVVSLTGAGSSVYYKALTEGTAKFTVKFNGNKDYLPSSRDITFTVGRKDPKLRVEPKEIDMKVSHDYLVAVYADCPDDFTYTSNNTSVAVMDEKGVHATGEGVAKITINFRGNDKYRPASDSLIVKVKAVKTYIDVNKTVSILPADTCPLNARIMGIDGNLVGYALNFASDNPDIVSVDDSGILTANGEGKARITITSGWIGEYAPSKAVVDVTVAKGNSIITADSLVEVNYNQRTDLKAKLNHEGILNYTSSNPDIVSVDKYGYVLGNRIGQATITVSFEETHKYKPATKKITVKVNRAPTYIDVGNTFAWLIGDTDYIYANLRPADAGHAYFISNNESVVKVNDVGKIEAVNVGKTTIDIIFSGNENYLPSNKTVQVAIYDSEIPTDIEVNRTFDLHVNDMVDMNAVINPSNAGKLNYTSSNPDIVSVDGKGRITAKKVGKATINVSYTGNHVFLSSYAEVEVSVARIPTSITADDSVTVNLTEFANLKYRFSHPKAGKLTFIFDDIDVASIDNGIIKGEEVGETTLTIKFDGNSEYAPSNTTVRVIVKDVETTISAPDSVEINITQADYIGAVLNPKFAGNLRFVSNNRDIISVTGNGMIYGIKLGNGTVTAVFDGQGKYRASAKTIKVTVKDVQPVIEVNDTVRVNLTETASVSAKVNPQSAGQIKYTTDSDIISIDQKGNVKGLKVGNATLKLSVSANGKYRAATKTITVVVSQVESSISIQNDEICLEYGDETIIEAILTPNDVGKLTFTSNDTDVVTVDENGVVKTVKPGVAAIEISYEGEGKYSPASKTVKVTVKRAPSFIHINDTMIMEIGIGINLYPSITPTGIKLDYSTSDDEVLMVENEFIFPLKYGNAVLNIGFAGNEYYLPSNAQVNVTVKSVATEIMVNDTLTIGYGDSKSLGAKIHIPRAGFDIDGKLIYLSSNPEIASVDEKTGLVTANDVGKTTIAIIYEGNNIYEPSNAIVEVEVTTRTTSINVDQLSVDLYVDDVDNVNATLIKGPENARLNYASADSKVVRINPLTGEMTAASEGKTTITVTYPGNDDYHESSANVSVSVSRYKTQIKAKTSYEMQVFDEMDLNAVSMPNEGQLTYESDDEEVVTVDAHGWLSAKKSGNAIITIRFAGDRKYLPSQKEVIVDVSRIQTSVNLTDIKLFTGQEYKLGKIVIPDTVPTRAKYYEYISWDSEVFDIDNGVITAFHEGSAELYVGFLGDDIYLPSNITVNVEVSKKIISADEYKFTVEVDDDAGEATFTFTLPEDAEGTFMVNINGEIYAESIVDGKAVVVVDDLTPGDYKATLSYSGDEVYAGFKNSTKFRVGKYKIDKNKDKDVLLGKTVKYTVHLTKDTQAMENKTIKFRVNGKTYYAVTDRNGYASIIVKLPAMKKYTVTAQYGSIKVKNKIKVHVIDAKNLKVSKRSDYLKVKVSLKKVNKKYLSKKKVTLKFNGKTYTGKTNSKGVVTFTLKKSAFAKLKVGKSYNYTVKYSTDIVSKKIKIFK